MRLRRNADKSGTIAHVMRKILKWFAVTLAALFLAAFLAVTALAGWFYWNVAKALPDHRLASETPSWNGCVPAGSKHQYVPLSSMPENAVNAFLAAEDPDFFYRPALSALTEIVRALRGKGHLKEGRATLATMYARWLLICHGGAADHSLWHFKFALLTYRVARDLPKRNILETVINTQYFGRGSYGIAAGAEAYFHKPLGALSLAEMAFLVGVLKEPARYDGSRAHAEKFLLERRNQVLERMLRMGAMGPQQAEAAKREPLGLQKREPVSKEKP
jgi:penicillin-binding protein 1A